MSVKDFEANTYFAPLSTKTSTQKEKVWVLGNDNTMYGVNKILKIVNGLHIIKSHFDPYFVSTLQLWMNNN